MCDGIQLTAVVAAAVVLLNVSLLAAYIGVGDAGRRLKRLPRIPAKQHRKDWPVWPVELMAHTVAVVALAILLVAIPAALLCACIGLVA